MVTYKTFKAEVTAFTANGRDRERDALRGLAQQFINHEVGAEHLVNVTEMESGRYFLITVWYRKPQ